jgi:hypothetical protein
MSNWLHSSWPLQRYVHNPNKTLALLVARQLSHLMIIVPDCFRLAFLLSGFLHVYMDDGRVSITRN